MARCDHCGMLILFGGERTPEGRYCDRRCAQKAMTEVAAAYTPEEVIAKQVAALHEGLCPKCQGPGPVDLHTSHFVWSALLLTRWSSTPQISCRSCARSRQFVALLGSATLGWWGFPWGLVITPIQIARNLIALLTGPDPFRPSPKLDAMVRATLGTRVATLARARHRGNAGA